MYTCIVYLVYLFSVISQNLGWLLLPNHDSVVKIAPAPTYVELWLKVNQIVKLIIYNPFYYFEMLISSIEVDTGQAIAENRCPRNVIAYCRTLSTPASRRRKVCEGHC